MKSFKGFTICTLKKVTIYKTKFHKYFVQLQSNQTGKVRTMLIDKQEYDTLVR